MSAIPSSSFFCLSFRNHFVFAPICSGLSINISFSFAQVSSRNFKTIQNYQSVWNVCREWARDQCRSVNNAHSDVNNLLRSGIFKGF